jgi:ubiquitin-large subunit ribosomal protein L40e
MFTSKTIPLDVDPTDTICDIMRIIHEKEGIPTTDQRLILNGEKLGGTLSDYSIQKGTTIDLMPGMPSSTDWYCA